MYYYSLQINWVFLTKKIFPPSKQKQLYDFSHSVVQLTETNYQHTSAFLFPLKFFITLTLSSTLDTFPFFGTSATLSAFKASFVTEGTFSVYLLEILKSWSTGHSVLFKKGH
jgi:hypothetical protein